ncbi:3D domain-containing protein [Clostridium sp. A1-XYC3]|uniref:3D domain-containing protein n=1 Tax=Clostridium tanneri TaxID=3037988 RepID=A0ABU4JR73_9CLOT|nr:3D domain-containing protein [Clostridium sp. A1-XYC3]MDW8800453.1 3D domain-containing protein [Clostridium sp. A1-XYC3]
MNKKTLSVIMTLALAVIINASVFAAPSSGTTNTLKQTQDEKKKLQSKVQELDKQIDDVLKKIDVNKKSMNKIAENMKNTQAKLEAAEKNSREQEDLFKKRVRAMYISGADSYLSVVLSADNLTDLMSRVDMISKVIGYDNEITAKLREKQKAISKEKDALSNENKKLEALKESNENTLATLSKDIKAQKELLSKATEKENQLLAVEASSTVKKSGTLSRGSSKSISYSKVLTMQSTAYTGDGITASGAGTTRDAGGYSTIAVDPRVIPLGSRVYVEGYGYAVASDTGGAIKGNIIDVFFHSEGEARSWGRRTVTVYILN